MAQGVVVIADGSSRLGRAVAMLAAQQGFAVALNTPPGGDAGAAERTAEGIRAGGGVAVTTAANLEDAAAVERMFQSADGLGPVVGLVNNPDMLLDGVRVETAEQAQLVRMFSANVTAAFLCAGAAIRRMSRKHGGSGGSIVNISSPASRHGAPGHAVVYAAAKGAIDSFTNGLSMEVAREGVRVNTVRVAVSPADEPEAAARPQEVDYAALAAPILWLMSPEADYCHGIHIAATGGRMVNA